MKPGRFKHFLAVDWSGATGLRQKGIALAIAHGDGGPPVLVDSGKGWSRDEVLVILRDELPADTLVGLDLGIGLPFEDCGSYFPGWDRSPANAKALWAEVDRVCSSEPNLAVSSFVHHETIAQYYRRQPQGEGALFRCDGAVHGRGRFRVTEHAQAEMGCNPYSNFNLIGAAQVGKSSLTGMRMLHQLGDELPVWPVDPLPEGGSLIVEIYTSIAAREAGRSSSASKMRTWEALNQALAVLGSPPVEGSGPVDDHASDALLSAAWLRKVAHESQRWNPARLTPEIAATEGWTFGAP